MKKYIDAEKLKAEIERQQRNLIVLYNTEQVDIRRDCALQNGVYTYILDLITSLQQEQPKVDLGKEIDNFLNETGAPYIWCNDDEQKEWCSIIARYFWNKGYNARNK